jgi:hypothetical protein
VSKLVKIAGVLAIAVFVVAAKQLSSGGTQGTVPSFTAASSISPAELTRGVGPLRETQVDRLY